MTNIITTLVLMEQYGPRVNMETLAKLLGFTTSSLHNRLGRKELEIPTYLDGKMRFADTRDVAEFLDRKRNEARQELGV